MSKFNSLFPKKFISEGFIYKPCVFGSLTKFQHNWINVIKTVVPCVDIRYYSRPNIYGYSDVVVLTLIYDIDVDYESIFYLRHLLPNSVKFEYITTEFDDDDIPF